MRRQSFAGMNCSIARSLEVVGDWWTPLIVRDAMLGIRRFDDFQERLGISSATLARRLDALVSAGILERVPDDEPRGRHHYRLTEQGRDLWPVLAALREWGDRWLTGRGREPVVAEHDGCGGRVMIRAVCDGCGNVVEPESVRRLPGPGLVDPTFLPAVDGAG